MMVTAVPDIKPVITPDLVTLFQKRERRRGGPKDAPNPPQANSTSQKTYSFAIAPKKSDARTRQRITIINKELKEIKSKRTSCLDFHATLFFMWPMKFTFFFKFFPIAASVTICFII